MVDARIIRTDNFGMSGETPSRDEEFLLWPMPTEDCEAIAEILNSRVGDFDPWYYQVVPEDYQLQVFRNCS